MEDETPRCYRHPDRETLVSCSECGRPICEDCMNFAPVGIRCPEHASVGGRQAASAPQRHVRVARPRAGSLQAPATVFLVAANILVYLVTVFQGSGVNQPGGKLFENGALVGILVADGEWWRLGSAAFLHASILHIAFNMFALYWLGTAVEEAIGTGRFVLVYVASGLFGSAMALVFSSAFAVTVGASGAIFGIMGALLVLEYMTTGSFAGQAMGLILINMVITLTIPNISIGGHLGGLVGGIAATYALMRTRNLTNQWVGPALVAGIAVASFVVAYVRVESYGI